MMMRAVGVLDEIAALVLGGHRRSNGL